MHCCIVLLVGISCALAQNPNVIDLTDLATLQALAPDAGIFNVVCQLGNTFIGCFTPPSPEWVQDDICNFLYCFDPTGLQASLEVYTTNTSIHYDPTFTLVTPPEVRWYCASQKSIDMVTNIIGTDLRHLLVSGTPLTDSRLTDLSPWLPEVYAAIGCIISPGTADACVRGLCGMRGVGDSLLPPTNWSCQAAVRNPVLSRWGARVAWTTQPTWIGPPLTFTGGNPIDLTLAPLLLNRDYLLFPRNQSVSPAVANTWGTSLFGFADCNGAYCTRNNPAGMFVRQIDCTPCLYDPVMAPSMAPCNTAICNGAGYCGVPIMPGSPCTLPFLGSAFEAHPLGGALGRAHISPDCIAKPALCFVKTNADNGVPADVATYINASLIWAIDALAAPIQLVPSAFASVASDSEMALLQSVSLGANAPAICAYRDLNSLQPLGTPCMVPEFAQPPWPSCVQPGTPQVTYSGVCYSFFASPTTDEDDLVTLSLFPNRPQELAFAQCRFIPLQAGVGCAAEGLPPNGTSPMCRYQACDGLGTCAWFALEAGTICVDPSPGLTTSCEVWRCTAAGFCVPLPLAEGTACSDLNACTVGDACDAIGVCLGAAIFPADQLCVLCLSDGDCVCTGQGTQVGTCQNGACSLSATQPPDCLNDTLLEGIGNGGNFSGDAFVWQPWETAIAMATDWTSSFARSLLVSNYPGTTLSLLASARWCSLPTNPMSTLQRGSCLRGGLGVCRLGGICDAPLPAVRWVVTTPNSTSGSAPDMPCTDINCTVQEGAGVSSWFVAVNTRCGLLGSCYTGGVQFVLCALYNGSVVCPGAPGSGVAPTVSPLVNGSVCPAPKAWQPFADKCVPGHAWRCDGQGNCLPTDRMTCTYADVYGPAIGAAPSIPCFFLPSCSATLGTCIAAPRSVGTGCPDVCAAMTNSLVNDATLLGICNGNGQCLRGGGVTTCKANSACQFPSCSRMARIAPGNAPPVGNSTVPAVSALEPFPNVTDSVGPLDPPATVAEVIYAWAPSNTNASLTGVCIQAPTEDFSGNGVVGSRSCFTGNLCRIGDACDGAGGCALGPAVVCPIPNQCTIPLGCSNTTGRCISRLLATGTPCTLTAGDIPAAGPPIQCTVNTTCNNLAVCQGTSLGCPQPPSSSTSSSCNTFVGACAGVVQYFSANNSVIVVLTNTGGSSGPFSIFPNLTQFLAQTVANASGAVWLQAPNSVCLYQQATEGSPCFDFPNNCTTRAVCSRSVCVTTGTRICPTGAGGVCRATTGGVCDVLTGQCTYPFLAVGTTCNDNNVCTRSDVCQASGECAGVELMCQPPLRQCFVSVGNCTIGCQQAPTDDFTLPCACTGGGTSGSALSCGHCDTNGTCSFAPTCTVPCTNGQICTSTDTCACPSGMCGLLCDLPCVSDVVLDIFGWVAGSLALLAVLAVAIVIAILLCCCVCYGIFTCCGVCDPVMAVQRVVRRQPPRRRPIPATRAPSGVENISRIPDTAVATVPAIGVAAHARRRSRRTATYQHAQYT